MIQLVGSERMGSERMGSEPAGSDLLKPAAERA